MDNYEKYAAGQIQIWRKEMISRPSLLNKLSKRIQTKVNAWIPEKVHVAITTAIKQMVRGVLFGSKYTTSKPMQDKSLEVREAIINERIKTYKKTAAIEGGITGAGGILFGLADFPILIGIKIKLLFDIASLYGFDVNHYKERVFILHIFELAFSSHAHRKEIFLKMENWNEISKTLPEDINQFDWRNFQQEYRDYIDLAKMAQLVPIIGAPIGIVVNYRLLQRLGFTAMNAYRMRLLNNFGKMILGSING